MIDGPEAFSSAFDVSRETTEKLEVYLRELKRWQKAVNLVAPSTLGQVWQRHFADSAQLAAHIPASAQNLVDVGSGGGFPGLVLAAMLHDTRGLSITLVESDTRKAAFLRETARQMEIPVEILSTRIESDASVKRLNRVDTVTARAFAPLSRLFGLVLPVFSRQTVGVFLKGRVVDQELQDAGRLWSFDSAMYPSLIEPDGRIVLIRNLAPRSEA